MTNPCKNGEMGATAIGCEYGHLRVAKSHLRRPHVPTGVGKLRHVNSLGKEVVAGERYTDGVGAGGLHAVECRNAECCGPRHMERALKGCLDLCLDGYRQAEFEIAANALYCSVAGGVIHLLRIGSRPIGIGRALDEGLDVRWIHREQKCTACIVGRLCRQTEGGSRYKDGLRQRFSEAEDGCRRNSEGLDLAFGRVTIPSEPV